VSDYSRYLPRDVGVRESFWWTYLGAFIGGAWMMLVGTLAAAAAPGLDVAAAMQRAADMVLPGLGKVLLFSALLEEYLAAGISQFEFNQPDLRGMLTTYRDGRWLLMFSDDQERDADALRSMVIRAIGRSDLKIEIITTGAGY